jgi:flagellar hook-associated protein 1 FlgK
MSLSTSLQIGRSALLASQAAIDTAGNNLANVATRGYHRQTVNITPVRDQEVQTGIFIGRGVQVANIVRQIDEALETRIRNGLSDEAGSLVQKDVLSQIEALQNELTDVDLSSYLSSFFNGWSELANDPEDFSLRTIVLQQGQNVADYMNNLRTELTKLRTQVDDAINAAGAAANDILDRLEQINGQIVALEKGGGGAHGLRDQRDILINELAQYLEISTVEQPSGTVDVFVGSLPLVLNGKSRGLEVERGSIEGELTIRVQIAADESQLAPSSGRLGSLVAVRSEQVQTAIDTLDEFAGHLIFQLNRIHSQGQGTQGFAGLTGEHKVADTAAALNSAAAGLHFAPNHGTFQIHLTQKSTGQRSTAQIAVDLDGINPGSDTSLASLAAALDAVANLDASITADGRLKIQSSSSDFEFTFSDDSSGVLASLGLNTFFTGTDAGDIKVNPVVNASPGLIAAGQGHLSGDNRNALALSALRNTAQSTLSGLSLTEFWSRHVEDFAVRLGQAEQQLNADTIVRENLEAQQQSVSGVNADEEAINLLSYQRTFQASARFLSVVDELMQTVLNLL